MSESVLSGTIRQPGRKGPAKRMRVGGLLPGVIYGQGENVTVAVPAKEVIKILEQKGGVNRVISTHIEGDTKHRKVMIKSLDIHPVRDTLLHIDLQEINMAKPVRVTVKMEFTGAAKGVKEKGGELTIVAKKLNIEALPERIPPYLTISIADLDAGQTWKVKDIPLPEGSRAIDNPEATVIFVTMPKQVEAAAPVETKGKKK